MATRSQDVNKKQTAVSSCEKVQETLNLVNTKGVLRGADSLSPTFQTVQRQTGHQGKDWVSDYQDYREVEASR